MEGRLNHLKDCCNALMNLWLEPVAIITPEITNTQITSICRPPHSPYVSAHKGQIGAAIQLRIAGVKRVL